MNARCLHSQHGFNVYGRSTYTETTCPKCLLSAYNSQQEKKNTQRFFSVRQQKRLPPEKKVNDLFSKSKFLTPLTDATSHFPSPGGEAQCNIYQPHLPLMNCAEEIRPSEVPKFTEKLKNPTDEILYRCKSPWEQKITDENYFENDEKPSIISITEQKIKDISCGQKLLQDKEKLQKLANQQFYKSSTQKFYEGVDWRKILKHPRPSPLPPSKHDKSDIEGQIRRHYGRNEEYQRLSEARSWDVIQTRDGHYVKRPISFMSESKKTCQIPNYSGTTAGSGEKDVENERFTPLTIMRTQQPKFSATGRKPHIPGYTGCVLNEQYREVLSYESLPRAETTARVHSRFNNYPVNLSRYNHQSLLSNGVTLTHPFNPFNQLAPSAVRSIRSANVY